MTKKQLIEAFEEATDLTKKENGTIHFFNGALCMSLAYKCCHDSQEANNLATKLLNTMNQIF